MSTGFGSIRPERTGVRRELFQKNRLLDDTVYLGMKLRRKKYINLASKITNYNEQLRRRVRLSSPGMLNPSSP